MKNWPKSILVLTLQERSSTSFSFSLLPPSVLLALYFYILPLLTFSSYYNTPLKCVLCKTLKPLRNSKPPPKKKRKTNLRNMLNMLKTIIFRLCLFLFLLCLPMIMRLFLLLYLLLTTTTTTTTVTTKT